MSSTEIRAQDRNSRSAKKNLQCITNFNVKYIFNQNSLILFNAPSFSFLLVLLIVVNSLDCSRNQMSNMQNSWVLHTTFLSGSQVKTWVHVKKDLRLLLLKIYVQFSKKSTFQKSSNKCFYVSLNLLFLKIVSTVILNKSHYQTKCPQGLAVGIIL